MLSYVDPFIGTDGKGKTFRGATIPYGMLQLSPDNGRGGWGWITGYFYPDNIIAGFCHTHPEIFCNGNVFTNQITTLTNAGHQCITLEYDQHDNLSDVASHALHLFDEGEPFSICAFSMGGMMAFELLAHVPEQIEKIALLDSNAHADKSQG